MVGAMRSKTTSLGTAVVLSVLAAACASHVDDEHAGRAVTALTPGRVTFETWQFNGIHIDRPHDWVSPGWCGGDCREGEDETFEIRGNNGSSEWVIAHEQCCPGWPRGLYVSNVWYDKPVRLTIWGDSIYFARKYWSVDEDRVSEGGCGDAEGRIEEPGYWASDVECDGNEHVHRTARTSAQCGSFWVEEHYRCWQ
jgi:hypothetical protein